MKVFLFLVICVLLCVGGKWVYDVYSKKSEPAVAMRESAVSAEYPYASAVPASLPQAVAVTYPSAPQTFTPSSSGRAAAPAVPQQETAPKEELTHGYRSALSLRNVATSKWTTEEAESNPRLYFECYSAEIRMAMDEIQRQIGEYERDVAKNKRLEDAEDNKIAKCNQFLKKAQELIKNNKFPADLEGEPVSKDELQSLRISYDSLRTQAKAQKTQYANLIQIAETQLSLLRPEMQKKKADLETAGNYLKRLDAKERIENIRAIFENLRAGKSLAETIDETFNDTFVEEDLKNEAKKVEEQSVLDKLDNEVFE